MAQQAYTPTKILALERRKAAVLMKKEGHTYGEIAQALGYAHRTGAHKTVKIALKELAEETRDEVEAYRMRETIRLEAEIDEQLGIRELALEEYAKDPSAKNAPSLLNVASNTGDVINRLSQSIAHLWALRIIDPAEANNADAKTIINQINVNVPAEATALLNALKAPAPTIIDQLPTKLADPMPINAIKTAQ